MNRAQAFHAWASGFGLPAYSSASVPDDAAMPYITYTYGFNSFGEEYEAELNIWDRGNGEAFANAKTEEVYASIGHGGTMLPCDNGGIWIKRGTPFCQTIRDSADVHRRYINVTIENLTSE